MKTDELDHKFEDFFTWRWDARGIQTFIERVHDKISRAERRHGKHLFEAFYHGTIVGLPFSTVMCVIKVGE